jgi:hypothetical protein
MRCQARRTGGKAARRVAKSGINGILAWKAAYSIDPVALERQ